MTTLLYVDPSYCCIPEAKWNHPFYSSFLDLFTYRRGRIYPNSVYISCGITCIKFNQTKQNTGLSRQFNIVPIYNWINKLGLQTLRTLCPTIQMLSKGFQYNNYIMFWTVLRLTIIQVMCITFFFIKDELGRFHLYLNIVCNVYTIINVHYWVNKYMV